ncbi:MAG: leucine-rich repeat protein [Christensenellaceae bacterium]|jgi:uncharacterized repeat protein (TIGR02543 family)|nr:leucine-rich repeat protein [Christensenellaceae bacterium]
MSKKLIFMLVLISIAIFIFILVACTTDNAVEEKLVLENQGTIEFTVNSVNLGTIRFSKVNGTGEVLERYTLTEDMLSSDDRAKLKSVGAHGVTIHVDTLTLVVTINILALQSEFDGALMLDASPGAFQTELGELVTYMQVNAALGTATNYIPSPIREGYDFAGWYKTQDLAGAKIETPYVVTQSHTLYAKWVNSTKREIRFVDYDANFDQTTLVPDGESFFCITPQDQEGKRFSGWRLSTDSDPNYTAGMSVVANANMTFFASFVQIKFQVNFFADAFKTDANLTGVTTIDVDYGTNLTQAQMPDASIVGKTYVWRDRATSLIPVLTNIKSNMNIDAVYTTLTHTLRFFMPMSSLPPNFNFEQLDYTQYEVRTLSTLTVNYNEHVPNTPIVSGFDLADGRDGYDGDWTYRTAGSFSTVAEAKAVLASGITNDYDFYARYTVRKFTITFVYGTDSSNKTSEFLTNQPYNTVLTSSDFPNINNAYPPKSYTTTWKRGGIIYDGSTVLVTSDITFEATHEKNPYTVEFYYPEKTKDNIAIDYSSLGISDYTQPVKREVAHGQTVSNVPSFGNNPQYKIIGWLLGANTNALTPDNIAQMPIEDFYEKESNNHFTAVVEIIEYTVIFYSLKTINSSSGAMEYEVAKNLTNIKYGSSITTQGQLSPPATTTKPSYEPTAQADFSFIGWHDSKNFATLVIDFEDGYKIETDTNFYPEWMDLLKGTPGLVFEAYGNDLALTGFAPSGITIFETVVIPQTYNNKNVIKIAASAFADMYFPYQIENIMFGSSIKEIESGAFSNLAELKSFIIMNFNDQDYKYFVDDGILFEVLQTGSASLFAYPANKDPSNKEYTIPTTVSSNAIVQVSSYAFAYSRCVEKIIFPTSPSQKIKIASRAFFSAELLAIVQLTDAISEIGDEAFARCDKLSSVTISDQSSLKQVGRDSFAHTPWQASQGTTVILGTILLKYTGTSETFVVDNSITAIASNAFSPSPGDSIPTIRAIRFNVQSNLSYIATNAFANTAIQRVMILINGTVEIQANAFGASINSERTLEVYSSSIVSSYQSNPTITSMFSTENIKVFNEATP